MPYGLSAREVRRKKQREQLKKQARRNRPHYVGPSRPRRSLIPDFYMSWFEIFACIIGLSVVGGVGFGVYKLGAFLYRILTTS